MSGIASSSPNAAPNDAPPSHGRRVTLTVAGILFMLLLDGTILNTSLPAMALALKVTPLTLSAAVTVYLLTGAAVLPLASWLGDRYGQRRVFVAAVATFTFASVLCGLAQTAPQLVVARALQGIGSGLMLPTGRTLAMHQARKEDIIGITALLTWPALFAPVLGPPLGGLITTYASWRWNFLLNAPLGLVSVFLILRWFRADEPGVRRPLDIAGAIGAGLGLALLIGGLEWIAHVLGQGAQQLAAIGTIGLGIAFLTCTVRHLQRTPHPVISLAPLSQHTFAAATAAGGTFASMCIQAPPFLLPLLFQLALGRNAVNAGALLLPYFLGNLGMKSVTTPILLRFGFRRVMVVTGLLNALAISAFGLLSTGTPWLLMVALLSFAGCTRSMLMTSINTLAFADVPQSQRPAASSLFSVSMQVASALGVAVGAILLGLGQVVHGDPQLSMGDFRVAFFAIGLTSALTVIAFWRLPPGAGAEMMRPTRKA
jgi:MFS family permease